MAHHTTDPVGRAEALMVLVDLLAEAGACQRAEAVARTLIDPADQASALTRVAEALTSDPPHDLRWPARLVADALALGHWSTTLRVLLRLERTAVAAIADGYLTARTFFR